MNKQVEIAARQLEATIRESLASVGKELKGEYTTLAKQLSEGALAQRIVGELTAASITQRFVGPIGPKGDKGDRGLKGDKGEPGPQGIEGKAGRDGKDGVASVPQELIHQSVRFILDSEADRFRGPEGKAGPAGIPGMRMRGEWKSGEKYSEGDLVALGGDIWYADNDGPETRPGRGLKWKLFLRSQAGRLSGYGVVQGQGGGSGISSLTPGTTPITSGVANSVLFVDATGVLLSQSADLKFAASTGVLTIGGSTAGAGIVITGGTITASSPLFSGTQTWNNAGTTFIGGGYDITDSASASGSLALRIRGGAAGTTSLFSVDKNGKLLSKGFPVIWGGDGSVGTANVTYISNGGFQSTNGVAFTSTKFGIRLDVAYTWSNATGVPENADTGLSRISAAVVGVGNATVGDFSGRLKLTSVITAAVAVGSLNASPTIGEVQTVNDALAIAAKGATVSAGGSAVCQVMWNGSNWVGT